MNLETVLLDCAQSDGSSSMRPIVLDRGALEEQKTSMGRRVGVRICLVARKVFSAAVVGHFISRYVGSTGEEQWQ